MIDEDDLISEPGDFAPGIEETITLRELSKKREREDEKCWGCEHTFGATRLPGQNKAMEKLWREFDANVGTMSLFKLTKHIRQIWKDEIFYPAAKDGVEMDNWDEEMIYIHFKSHLKHARLMIHDSMIKCATLEDHMCDNVVLKSGKVDPTHIKSLLAVMDMKTKLVEKLDKFRK